MISEKPQNSPNKTEEDINLWETKGLELLHQKDKYDFTLLEKQLIKNILKESPPPLQYRRKVNIFILIIF